MTGVRASPDFLQVNHFFALDTSPQIIRFPNFLSKELEIIGFFL